MAIIQVRSWEDVKNFINERGLETLHFIETVNLYEIIAIDGELQLGISLSKNGNDPDVSDFETNFKPYGNKTLRDIGYSVSRFTDYLKDSNGNEEMNIDGSTPVEFSLRSHSEKDRWISEIKFLAEDSNINLSKDRFLDQNNISNGFIFKIISDNGRTLSFPTIMNTRDIISFLADLDTAEILTDSGVLIFSYKPSRPLVLRPGTNDKISFTVQDKKVKNIKTMVMSVRGFEI